MTKREDRRCVDRLLQRLRRRRSAITTADLPRDPPADSARLLRTRSVTDEMRDPASYAGQIGIEERADPSRFIRTADPRKGE